MDRRVEADSAQNPLHWVIEHEGRFIGTARLHDLDSHAASARFAIGIYDIDLPGRGLGTEAAGLVVDHGFDHIGLHRIDLIVLDINHRAIGSYRKLGFVEEG